MKLSAGAPLYDVLAKPCKAQRVLKASVHSGCCGATRAGGLRRHLRRGQEGNARAGLCFYSEAQVATFQQDAGVASEMINEDQIELQPEAMKALLKAREDAQKKTWTSHSRRQRSCSA